MPKKNLTQRALRMAKMREKRKNKGLVQVEVWVPEADREALKAYAVELRHKAGLRLYDDLFDVGS